MTKKPKVKKRRTTPVEVRFWDKVEKSDDCWIWKGALTGYRYRDPGFGYGIIGRGGRNGGQILAHRLSYEIHYGDIPEGEQVLHKCDTPSCVNPEHLFLGTQQDNMDDMIQKGRNRNSKLSRRHVKRIRELYAKGTVSYRDLADMFGVSFSHIGRIIRHQYWS